MPENIRALHELRYFNISHCTSTPGLPQWIQHLRKLEILHNEKMVTNKCQFADESVSHLTGLCELDEFKGRLSNLKKLNQLRGQLLLLIQKLSDSDTDVQEAKEAEMNKKKRLQRLQMNFIPIYDDADASKNMDWMGVLDAPRPHQNLDFLGIRSYAGSKFPSWMTSPHNHVKKIELAHLFKVVGLPSLGKLPCLEVLEISYPYEMEVLGREILGIAARRLANAESSPTPTSVDVEVAFPMLKELNFYDCEKWKEWEDIAIEEEASTTLSLFPSLEKLGFFTCHRLRELPHRLLCGILSIRFSPLLQQRYDKNYKHDSPWNPIAHIPIVEICGR